MNGFGIPISVLSNPEIILPELSESGFSDLVGIFSLPISTIMTPFETMSETDGRPTERLKRVLVYGSEVNDLSYLPAL